MIIAFLDDFRYINGQNQADRYFCSAMVTETKQD